KMILCNSEGDYKIELDYITMAKQNQVDGIIAITYSDIEAFISSNLPMVSVDRFFNEEITYVSSDNLMGGYLAAQKLIESGCQSICFIGEGSKKDNSTRNRKKGFINYCEEHRIDYQVCEMIGDHDKFDETLKQFLMDNLIQQKKIDGIFTVTDAYAYFIIEKLKEYHLSVPEDVQIIGFDGAKSSKKSVIEISTIRQPIELIAKHTVESIDALINKQTIEKEIILPVEFHQGSTTKH
ncbi:substrate-binding domain-containing protein, partial [Turicibacter sanguinis]|nr:substrate-binding domain-containing protein [Turicibacter sanguinis]